MNMSEIKLKESMGGVDWIGGDEGSSFFEEVVEFAVFSSGVVILSGLVGYSGDSDVDFGEFFEWQFFSVSEFVLFLIGLFSIIVRELL